MRRGLLAAALGSAVLWGATVPLDAQEGEWWEGIERLSPGFHAIEVDSSYTVSGVTHEDVLRDMERNGPGDDDLGPRLGLHLSQWRYSYRSSFGGGSTRCRLAEAQVLLRSVIILPRWTNAAAAPPEVSRGWRPFLGALRTHEEGHRSRAKQQGVTLWAALLGLEAPTCDELQARVRATAERVLSDGQEAQRAYDRETGHGSTQGASWPG